MTKSELTLQLINRIDSLAESVISDAANGILELICQSLEKGERVEVRGFGSFSLHSWGERHARNPATGKTWRTDPVRAVHFKPGKDLRERVNASFLAENVAKKAKKQTQAQTEEEAA